MFSSKQKKMPKTGSDRLVALHLMKTGKGVNQACSRNLATKTPLRRSVLITTSTIISFIEWLPARSDTMKQILYRDCYARGPSWSYLAHSELPVTRAPLFTVNPLLPIIVIIGQVCSVTVAEFWPIFLTFPRHDMKIIAVSY